MAMRREEVLFPLGDDVSVGPLFRDLPVEALGPPVESRPAALPGAPALWGEGSARGLVAGVADEIRAPLTLILDPIEALLAQPPGTLDAGVRRQLVTVQQNARQLHQLVDMLSEWSEIEAGRTRLEVGEHDLGVLVEEQVARHERVVRWNRIGFELTPAAAVHVHFCPRAMAKVFSLLLGRVLTAVPEAGRIVASVGREKDGRGRAYLRLRGMPARPEGREPDGWRGRLSMTIARALVRLHDGELETVASDGHLECTVYLRPGRDHFQADVLVDDRPPPARRMVVAPPAPLEEPPQPGPDAADATQSVLIVGHSAEMRSHLHASLGAYFRVEEARDGREALACLARRLPDLIICDTRQPEGRELLRAVKADPHSAHIAFIQLTSQSSEELRLRTLEAGAIDYVIKPFSGAALRAKIRNLLAISVREKQAQALAHRAQLQMLRYQLNPHFLFNALNTLRALVVRDADRARGVVTELSEYLRYSLLTAGSGEASVADELQSVNSYLAIERIRFEEDLQVTQEVDPAAAAWRVPSILLQPLVENAVKYGMQTSAMPLRLLIRAAVREGRLRLEVANSGRWVAPDAPGVRSTGVGLRNVRERLAVHYPDRHTFEIGERDAWVRAVIAIGP